MKKIYLLLLMLIVGVSSTWADLTPTVSDAPSGGNWASNTTWYKIKLQGGYYLSTNSDYCDGYNLKVRNTTEPTTTEGAWCIVGSNGSYQLYNYCAGTARILGVTGDGADARTKMYTVESVPSGVTTSFSIKDVTNGDNTYDVIYYSTNNAFNDRDGYLALWNSSYAIDGTTTGSNFTFEEVTISNLTDYMEYTFNFMKDNSTVYTTYSTQKVGDAFTAPTATDFVTYTTTDYPTTNAHSKQTVNIPVTYTTPFDCNDSYSSINKWYNLKINTGGKIVYNNGTSPIALSRTTTNNTAFDMWAFVGNPFEGFQIYNKRSGDSKVLATTTTNPYDGDTGSKTYVTVQDKNISGGVTTWKIYSSSKISGVTGFCIGMPHNNVKMNDRGKLAFWTTTYDEGSTFQVAEVTEGSELTLPDNGYYFIKSMATSGSNSWSTPVYLKDGADAKKLTYLDNETTKTPKYIWRVDFSGNTVCLRGTTGEIAGYGASSKVYSQITAATQKSDITVSATTVSYDGSESNVLHLYNFHATNQPYYTVSWSSFATETNPAFVTTWDESTNHNDYQFTIVDADDYDIYTVENYDNTLGTSVTYNGTYDGNKTVNLNGFYAFTAGTTLKAGDFTPNAVDGYTGAVEIDATNKIIKIFYIPIVTTTITDGKFADDTKWYNMNVNNNSSMLIFADERSGNDNVWRDRTTTVSDMYKPSSLWCFVEKEGSKGEFYIYNMYKGVEKTMYNSEDGTYTGYNQDIAIMGASTVEGQHTWCIRKNGNGWRICAPDDNTANFGNHKSTNLAIWQHANSPTADGSRIYISEANVEYDLEGTIAKAKALDATKGKVGYPASTESVYTDLESAISTAESATESWASCTALSKAIETFKSDAKSLTYVTPTAGHFYKIQGRMSGNCITSTNNSDSDPKATMSGTFDKTGVFYLDNAKHMISYATGYRLGMWTWRMSTTPEDAVTIEYTNGSDLGYITMKASYTDSYDTGKYLYDNTTYVNRNDNARTDGYTDWYFTELATIPVTLNANTHYGTLSSPVPVKVANGTTAYTADVEEGTESNTITLTRIDSKEIPANTAVVIYSGGETSVPVTVLASTTETATSDFKGNTDTKVVSSMTSNNIWVLSSNLNSDDTTYSAVFKQYTGTNFPGFKAYMELSSSAARNMVVKFDDGTTTSIESIFGGESVNKADGKYIENGKVVIVKNGQKFNVTGQKK